MLSFISGFVLPLMIVIGIKILLEPMLTSYLEFGIQFMGKSRKIDCNDISLDHNRDAAETLIYFLYLDSLNNWFSCSRRGLARDFHTSTDKSDRIVEKMKWRLHAYQELADEYERFLVERTQAEQEKSAKKHHFHKS